MKIIEKKFSLLKERKCADFRGWDAKEFKCTMIQNSVHVLMIA